MSAVYALLTQGTLSPEHQEHPDSLVSKFSNLEWDKTGPLDTSGLALYDPYATVYPGLPSPALTTKTDVFSGHIDHIWLNQGLLLPNAYLSLPHGIDKMHPLAGPSSGAGWGFSPIPSAEWPSDHLAMGLELCVDV